MNFKRILLILLCTVTLVGCSSSNEKNKKDDVKNKTEVTEKKVNDTKDKNILKEKKKEVNQTEKKQEEKKELADVEHTNNTETVAAVNETQQEVLVEDTQQENTTEVVQQAEDNTTENASVVDKVTDERAIELIKQDDKTIVEKALADGGSFKKLDSNKDIIKNWGLPEENVIAYIILNNESIRIGIYAVGVTTGNVYKLPSQGYVSAYLIQNGKKVKEYKWVE